ncbi:MAG: DUF4331 domain-containing protein [Candidatus Promineifilaceae bacterium]
MNVTPRHKRTWLQGAPLFYILLASLFLVTAVLLAVRPSAASSHREAPLISQDAFADNTDTYVFIPAGVTDRLVVVGSWIPFEGPEGGPNYWSWGKDVLYDIHLDTNGDATSDITYTLSSRVEIGNPDTFLYNTGPIDNLTDPDWNQKQYYTVVEQFAPGSQPAGVAETNVLVNDELAAPANVGSKSTPDYWKLARQARYTYNDPANGDSIEVFAGQTDDPFYVDLQVFDLLTLRGQAAPIGYPIQPNEPVDSLSGFNVHSLVIEIPISRLTAAYGDPVVGVWAATRRPSMTILGGGQVETSGNYVQVSRLGMPLVNEVVLPLGLKDTFNAISPDVDLTVYSLLQESVEDPEIGNLLCGLYGVPMPGDANGDCATEYTPGVPRSGRGDIFDIFLTGMVLANEFTINTANGPVTLPPGFNVNRPADVVPAEMIRINTAISGDLCAPEPSRLGVLGGDACGFPNGRRLADDIVEIELLAVAGAAYQVLDARDANFSFDAGLIDVLTDRIDANDRPFKNRFPYLAQAQSGQFHIHRDSGIFVPLALGGLALLGPMAFVWQRRRRSSLDKQLMD